MKKYFAGLITGILIALSFTAFASELKITQNLYKVFVNGEEKKIQGYNIDGYSYFKLRDVLTAINTGTVTFNQEAGRIDIIPQNSPSKGVTEIPEIPGAKLTMYNNCQAIELNGVYFLKSQDAIKVYNVSIDWPTKNSTVLVTRKGETQGPIMAINDKVDSIEYNGDIWIAYRTIESYGKILR